MVETLGLGRANFRKVEAMGVTTWLTSDQETA
jgi:hypothetical protein